MKKTIIILLLALVYILYNKLDRAGVFKKINNKFQGSVIKIYDNMPGTEDIDVDRKRGLIFISSDDRWTHRNGGQSESNGIYLLRPDSSDIAYKIPTTYTGEFHPHGISFFEQDNSDYLYVVNHNKMGNYVELFEYKNDTLFHLRTDEDDLMCCPNDVVGVDVNQFYVTNDHGNASGFMRKMEDYLGLAESYLLYYDDGKFSKAFSNLRYVNGVNMSGDKSKLYLTHTTGGELFIMDRDQESGALTVDRTLDLKTGVDNIDVDEEGNIWIGCHPQLLKFVAHSKGPQTIAPSQVIKINPNENYKVDEIYLNDGTEISASSVGVQFNGDLYIGVVFENKLLRGKLK